MPIADPEHERLTRLGLAALEDRGFALAGGYALAAHGIGSRPSDDIDLFTDRLNIDFTTAAEDLRTTYEQAGFAVAVARHGDEFARLVVTVPDGRATAVDLGRDHRSRPEVRLDIGPVLHLDDAIGSKVHVMYSRREPRDYLDVHTALRSGRFARDDLVELGDAREATPMDRELLARSLAYAARIADREFERYGAGSAEVAELTSTMTRWAADIDGPAAPPVPPQLRR